VTVASSRRSTTTSENDVTKLQTKCQYCSYRITAKLRDVRYEQYCHLVW